MLTPAIATVNASNINIKNTNKSAIDDSGFKGSVGFQTNEWVDDVGEVVGNKYWGEFDLGYDSTSAIDMDKKFRLKTRVNDEGQIMFSLPESYLKYDFGEHTAYFGRAILPWSALDAAWGFGKLNNRVNFDGFEPGQEGLAGVLVDFKLSPSVRLQAFASGLYIPEMNPGTKTDKDKGTVECTNPWCSAPDAEADTNDDGDPDTPIVYDVNMPEIQDIIFRYSIGGNIDLKVKDFGFNAFVIRKPENTISLSVEVSLDAPNNVVNAEITPQVYYQNVAGMEANYDVVRNVNIYASYLGIKPDKNPDRDEPLIVYTGIKPNKKDEEYVGTGVRYNNKNFKASVNYVARISEFDITDDVLVEYPRWNQAANLNLSLGLTRKLGLSFDYKYDMHTEDRLTMFRANYLYRPNIIITAGANVIGSRAENDSYWSNFVNNDTVYSSLKYTF